MGLFSFIENVGKKVFGQDDDETKKRDQIHEEIKNLNLPAHVSVEVDGNKVKLEGNTDNTETKEKLILAIGNIDGVQTIEENIITGDNSDTENTSKFITVETGDTLWKIAQEAYGDGSQYKIIFEANKPMLKDADSIYPGQQLRIPSLQDA